MSEGNQIQTVNNVELQRFSVGQVRGQIHAIGELMKEVLKENEHFGTIPGTKKPTLLKPGAEKVNFMFRLAASISGHENPRDLGNGHREYIIKTTLTHVPTGQIVGEGVGSASTLETKWKYRNKLQLIANELPKDYKENKAAYKSQGFVAKKDEVSNTWGWFKETKVENEPADAYNTVLKMAKKRALVDATLTSTAASDFFTQDVEDFSDLNEHETEQKKADPN
jgi:hypothetical protein